jgi:hypothetical protein
MRIGSGALAGVAGQPNKHVGEVHEARMSLMRTERERMSSAPAGSGSV